MKSAKNSLTFKVMNIRDNTDLKSEYPYIRYYLSLYAKFDEDYQDYSIDLSISADSDWKFTCSENITPASLKRLTTISKFFSKHFDREKFQLTNPYGQSVFNKLNDLFYLDDLTDQNTRIKYRENERKYRIIQLEKLIKRTKECDEENKKNKSLDAPIAE